MPRSLLRLLIIAFVGCVHLLLLNMSPWSERDISALAGSPPVSQDRPVKVPVSAHWIADTLKQVGTSPRESKILFDFASSVLFYVGCAVFLWSLGGALGVWVPLVTLLGLALYPPFHGLDSSTRLQLAWFFYFHAKAPRIPKWLVLILASLGVYYQSPSPIGLFWIIFPLAQFIHHPKTRLLSGSVAVAMIAMFLGSLGFEPPSLGKSSLLLASLQLFPFDGRIQPEASSLKLSLQILLLLSTCSAFLYGLYRMKHLPRLQANPLPTFLALILILVFLFILFPVPGVTLPTLFAIWTPFGLLLYFTALRKAPPQLRRAGLYLPLAAWCFGTYQLWLESPRPLNKDIANEVYEVAKLQKIAAYGKESFTKEERVYLQIYGAAAIDEVPELMTPLLCRAWRNLDTKVTVSLTSDLRPLYCFGCDGGNADFSIAQLEAAL